MRRGHDRSEPARYQALFGGRGEVRVEDLTAGAAPVPPFAAALRCELDPGGSVGLHVQTDFAEVVIFLEGRGLATVGAARTAVGPGSLVSVPLGEPLAIENASDDAPLRYLIVKAAPPG